MQTDLAALDLAHVENVVEQSEQILAGKLHLVHIVAQLVRVAHIVLHQVGNTHDRVHWCADIVAHVGKELGFGAVCALCNAECILGGLSCAFLALAGTFQIVIGRTEHRCRPHAHLVPFLVLPRLRVRVEHQIGRCQQHDQRHREQHNHRADHFRRAGRHILVTDHEQQRPRVACHLFEAQEIPVIACLHIRADVAVLIQRGQARIKAAHVWKFQLTKRVIDVASREQRFVARVVRVHLDAVVLHHIGDIPVVERTAAEMLGQTLHALEQHNVREFRRVLLADRHGILQPIGERHIVAVLTEGIGQETLPAVVPLERRSLLPDALTAVFIVIIAFLVHREKAIAVVKRRQHFACLGQHLPERLLVLRIRFCYHVFQRHRVIPLGIEHYFEFFVVLLHDLGHLTAAFLVQLRIRVADEPPHQKYHRKQQEQHHTDAGCTAVFRLCLLLHCLSPLFAAAAHVTQVSPAKVFPAFSDSPQTPPDRQRRCSARCSARAPRTAHRR